MTDSCAAALVACCLLSAASAQFCFDDADAGSCSVPLLAPTAQNCTATAQDFADIAGIGPEYEFLAPPPPSYSSSSSFSSSSSDLGICLMKFGAGCDMVWAPFAAYLQTSDSYPACSPDVEPEIAGHEAAFPPAPAATDAPGVQPPSTPAIPSPTPSTPTSTTPAAPSDDTPSSDGCDTGYGGVTTCGDTTEVPSLDGGSPTFIDGDNIDLGTIDPYN